MSNPMDNKRFAAFIGFVKRAETAYKKGHYGDDRFVLVERDPSDSGGTTKWGLDAATHGEGVAGMSWDEAMRVYFDWYWNGQTDSGKWISCNTLPYPLGEIVFDTRINSGMGAAKKILRQTTDPGEYLNGRDARNRSIAEAHPKDRKYLEGWLNRTGELRKRFKL